jgi:PAS domain S-box-containing protein
MRGKKNDQKDRRLELRRTAEKRIKASTRFIKKLSHDDTLELIHELEVHQVELELQNEELRRSQSELEESRRKYFDLYDLAPVGYVTLDRNGVIHEINLTGAKLLGTSRAWLKGKGLGKFVAPSSRRPFYHFCRRLFISGEREELEIAIAPGGNAQLIVLLAGVVNPKGNGASNLCQVTITDITARRSAESWVTKLIETTQDAVFSFDGKSQIALVNPAAEKIFGYAAAEVQGKNVSVLIPGSYGSARDRNKRFEETGEKATGGKIREALARRKNGEIFPVELSITEVDDRDGMRYVAFVRDVSERVRLQAQLMEKARLAVLDNTTAMVAHEIANPLHGMSLSVQLLQSHLTGIADGRVMTSLERISAELSRLKNMLYDFRTLSMKETYNLRPVALARVIREYYAGERAKLDSLGIRVELELKPGLPHVLADSAKIRQLLFNLCKNAEEAMPGGGTLTIKAYELEGDVMVEVTDTGIGLPADFKLDSPFKTTKVTGTGLGLIIVRQIVSRHQGSLSYASEPAKGTTFTVGFPSIVRREGETQELASMEA